MAVVVRMVVSVFVLGPIRVRVLVRVFGVLVFVIVIGVVVGMSMDNPVRMLVLVAVLVLRCIRHCACLSAAGRGPGLSRVYHLAPGPARRSRVAATC
ncbi:MAG: hypothetical protein ACREM2_01755 [Vulcanimicrobiaceae bacterium]